MPSSILNSADGVISGTSGLKSSGGDDGVLVFQSKGTETARINTDKQVVAAAGTVSLPIYSTTGDLNTGIFFPAADNIGFATNGVIRGRWTTDGLCFNADTAAANALDDYEEGTWTPTLGGQTTDPSSVTYITQTGNYTKIGNVVCVFGKVAASAITGGSGFAIIKGLPFTTKNSNVGAGLFAFYSFVALGAGYTQLALQIQANTTTVRFSKSGTGISGFPANIGDLASGGNFDCDFQITYEV